MIQHIQGKILGSPRRGDDAVGDRLAQLLFCCSGFLRDREVLLHSGGAPHGDGAADPDQFTGLGVKHLFILIIQNFLADLHKESSVKQAHGNPGDAVCASYGTAASVCQRLSPEAGRSAVGLNTFSPVSPF